MEIAFLMGRSFTDEHRMPEIARLLGGRGVTVKPLHLGDQVMDITRAQVDCDLGVLMHGSDLAMSVAADLDRAGAPLLNPYPVSALLRDPIVTSRVWQAAGVPVPKTLVASHASQLLPALDRGPLVVKPYRRSRAPGTSPEVVRDAAELAALGPIEEPVFAQRYHPLDGPPRKIYAIGGELFGVLRRQPERPLFPLSRELTDLARRCGAAFGIDLFGVDIVESGGRPYVVDMKSFPSFRGVPEAPRRLADYISAAAERVLRGEPIVAADRRVRGCRFGDVLRALNPRFLDVSDQELIALRDGVIRDAIKTFEPDVLLVDHLPLGAGGELVRTLERLRKRGRTRCVLGLREVLQDRETVRRTWTAQGYVAAMRHYYDAIWIYGDPAVFDPVREYDVFAAVADKVRYTGYLDQRPRLDFAGPQAAQLVADLLPGTLALCVVGGGVDGHALAEAFVQTELPADTSGLVVTGPYMPSEQRERLRHAAERQARCQVLEFLPDPVPLLGRADRVIAMGGYNTICEVLSFEKHALIVPRVDPEPEQWIRAQRLAELGLIDVLHPSELTSRALALWLARDLGPAPAARTRIDIGGLHRIPSLLGELLGAPTAALAPAPVSAEPALLPVSAAL